MVVGPKVLVDDYFCVLSVFCSTSISSTRDNFSSHILHRLIRKSLSFPSFSPFIIFSNSVAIQSICLITYSAPFLSKFFIFQIVLFLSHLLFFVLKDIRRSSSEHKTATGCRERYSIEKNLIELRMRRAEDQKT